MATDDMTISWRSDFDRGLDEAHQQQRTLLLDFSAVPM